MERFAIHPRNENFSPVGAVPPPIVSGGDGEARFVLIICVVVDLRHAPDTPTAIKIRKVTRKLVFIVLVGSLCFHQTALLDLLANVVKG